MYKEKQFDFEKMISKQQEELNKNNVHFNSKHEMYAVLLGEYQNLEEETSELKQELEEFWIGIRNGITERGIGETCLLLHEQAIKVACDAVNIAGMAKQAVEKNAEITDSFVWPTCYQEEVEVLELELHKIKMKLWGPLEKEEKEMLEREWGIKRRILNVMRKVNN